MQSLQASRSQAVSPCCSDVPCSVSFCGHMYESNTVWQRRREAKQKQCGFVYVLHYFFFCVCVCAATFRKPPSSFCLSVISLLNRKSSCLHHKDWDMEGNSVSYLMLSVWVYNLMVIKRIWVFGWKNTGTLFSLGRSLTLIKRKNSQLYL